MAQRKIVSDISWFNESIEHLRSDIDLLCNREGGCRETQDCLDMRRSVLKEFEKWVEDEKACLIELRERATGMHTDTDQSKTDGKSVSREEGQIGGHCNERYGYANSDTMPGIAGWGDVPLREGGLRLLVSPDAHVGPPPVPRHPRVVLQVGGLRRLVAE